ncbi:MAG: hypothetical protein A3I61_17535 [Acidobacteria bacterium RIFCSPLOWO2_02_FULL_68_18]|nr:MAG: hypothetical protein A3I61_17535 [Acidobacteria bacterium RIFCSPLOWO2_02_FULL_68_18]OFW51423.1 MAG: hypothetical protein A3G77_17980 [Acidobacteria bacterium RIFCSPLOWO2_12_FULL_68_19]
MAGDERLRFLLPGHQAVFVQDHLLALFPQLPGLRRDVFVDPLSQFAGPGRGVEAGQLLLELDASHDPATLVAGRRGVLRWCGSAVVHTVMVTRF